MSVSPALFTSMNLTSRCNRAPMIVPIATPAIPNVGERNTAPTIIPRL